MIWWHTDVNQVMTDREEHGFLCNKPTGVKSVPSDIFDEWCNWNCLAVVNKTESCSCWLNFL